jgi:serine phosphatase RsbU (regulator of sigma subunit)/Tfp pilus assembly protein PilF
MKPIFFVFFLLSIRVLTAAPIDSLKQTLKKIDDLDRKILILEEIIQTYTRISADTSLFYGNMALELIEKNNKIEKYRANILASIAMNYQKMGDYTKADSLFDLSLRYNEQFPNDSLKASIFNNYGLSMSDQHDYENAIKMYMRAIRISDSLGYFDLTVGTTVNVGIIYYYQGDVRSALNYHLRALNIFNKIEVGTTPKHATTLRNTGAFYHLLKINDSAMYYTKKALWMSQRIGDKRGVAICYQNLGELVSYKSMEEAEKYFLKSLGLKKELKNLRGVVHTSLSLGQMFGMKKKFKKAIEYINEGIKYAKIMNDVGLISNGYMFLYQVYENMGATSKAFESYKFYSDYKDSLAQRTKEAKLLELQTKYETLENERKIQTLQHQKRLDQIKIKSSKVVNRIIIIAIVLISILLGVVLRAFYRIKKVNRLLNEKNTTIESQKEEITVQRDNLSEQNMQIQQQKEEILVQRDHLAERNGKIEYQNNQINDSIAYARQIQDSLLPSQTMLKLILKDFFIFFKPKDIVSGDFYWLFKKDNKVFLAVGDCTGHGVPGAFMSVLSISLLNEIVKGEHLTEPSDILNQMRALVISSLKQTTEKMGGKDGLELAFVTLDLEKGLLKYSGANRPLLFIRDGELVEYKTNTMPISSYVKMNEFDQIEIQYKNGDTIYLFSDGFYDQFNGKTNKKYSKKRFYELLKKNSKKPMSDQDQIIRVAFETWRSGEEQIDDVIVLGTNLLLE